MSDTGPRIHVGVSNNTAMPVFIQIDRYPGVIWEMNLQAAEWLRDELFAVCARLKVRADGKRAQ